jgi:transcriptional regulator with XRE-family HTH domain
MKNDEVSKIVTQLVGCMKELRLKQGISHDTLAERSGLTRQSISMIESGRRTPSIASCLKVAKGLGMTLQKLLDMAEKRAKKS